MAKKETLRAEKETKKLMEEARKGLIPHAQQSRMIREQHSGLLPPRPNTMGFVEPQVQPSKITRGVADLAARVQHRRVRSEAAPVVQHSRIPVTKPLQGRRGQPDAGLEESLRQRMSPTLMPTAASNGTTASAPVRAADIVAAQDAEMADVTPGQGGGRKGALLQSPLEQSGFRELVGPQPETGARTTYTDDKGSFLTSTGRAKGGGTYSEMAGPGSANFTPEEWKGMSAAQRSQANVDALKGATEAVRGVTAQAREGRQGGRGALVSAPSAFTQRKLMREYGMAVSSLKNDLRRGRVSSKKGRALAGVIQDYYGKALGKDPRELELAMAQEEGKTERTGLIDAGATERVGMEEEGEMERARMPKPQTFSSQVIGEELSGQKRYGLIGTGGGTKPIHDINLATMEQARAMVLEAKGDPELYQQRIAKFIEDFGQENWHD